MTHAFTIPGAPRELMERINKRRSTIPGGMMMMADPAAPTPVVEAGKQEQPDEKKFSQADLDRAIGERLARENIADLKRKAEAHDKAEQAKLTAEEQARIREKAAEDRATAAERRALRAEASAEAGAIGDHGKYAALIGGDDEAQIEASAQLLGELLEASKELARIKGQQGGAQQRPRIDQMIPGAMGQQHSDKPNGSAGIAEAERRFPKPSN